MVIVDLAALRISLTLMYVLVSGPTIVGKVSVHTYQAAEEVSLDFL